MSWKTYLVMYFGAKGMKPTEVAQKLEKIGFVTTFGSVDFIYEWKTKPTKEQVLSIADKITLELKDSGVVFNLDTHD